VLRGLESFLRLPHPKEEIVVITSNWGLFFLETFGLACRLPPFHFCANVARWST
jgi:hypothetical protein